MVQIIPERRNPSVGQRLSAGVGRGLDIGQQLMQAHEQKQLLAQQQAAIDKLFPEAAGLSPELQKVYVQEQMKSFGKQQRQEQSQQFLQKIFGGQKSPQGLSQQLSGEPGEQGFNPANISDADIAMVTAQDPNLGKMLQQQKDVAFREKRAKEQFEFEKYKTSPEFKRETQVTAAQAKADVDYNKELQTAHKTAKLKTDTLDRLDHLNKKGVTGKPYEKWLENHGLVALTSEGRREFAADVKNLITDIRSILGAQFSQFEFQTILNAYPSPDFSKEANEAIIKNLKEFQDIRNKEFEIANEIKKENKGKIPEDFQAKANERLQEYAQSKMAKIKENTQKILAEEYGITPGNVLMLDPSGEPLDVPPSEVQRYQELGAILP